MSVYGVIKSDVKIVTPYLAVPPGLVQHDARGEGRGAQQLPRVETSEPRLDGRGSRDHLRYTHTVAFLLQKTRH